MEQFDPNYIKRLIEEEFSWGPSDEWTNFHFKELKIAIEERTGDSLSEETLKRIFGKRKVDTKNYRPQAFSKLALIKFANSLQQTSAPGKVRKPQNRWRKILIMSIIPVLFVGGMFVIIKSREVSDFTFTCQNPSELAPYTATFSYDVSEIKDSVFANFGYWGEYYLPPEKKTINFFYRMPGVFNVKLYTRSKVLNTSRIIAYSSDWQGGYYPNRADSLYEPFINQSFYRHDGFFYADPDPLFSEEGVNLRDRYYTAFRYFSPFNKSLDSLSLETTIENNASTGSMLCYDAGLQLIGESGIIDFNFTQSRCSRFAGIRVSEKYLSGEDTDLKSLAVDMSAWLNVKIVNENKVFNLYLDEQLIFEQPYEKPLGDIVGIVIYFSGSGRVDDLKVFDQDQKLFYGCDFGRDDSN
nr:hypothetical protein [uncultured Draconibacterium sp.]